VSYGLSGPPINCGSLQSPAPGAGGPQGSLRESVQTRFCALICGPCQTRCLHHGWECGEICSDHCAVSQTGKKYRSSRPNRCVFASAQQRPQCLDVDSCIPWSRGSTRIIFPLICLQAIIYLLHCLLVSYLVSDPPACTHMCTCAEPGVGVHQLMIFYLIRCERASPTAWKACFFALGPQDGPRALPEAFVQDRCTVRSYF